MSLMLTIAGGIVLGVLALLALSALLMVVIAKVQEHREEASRLEAMKRHAVYEQQKERLKKKWEKATLQQVEAFFAQPRNNDAPLNLDEWHCVTERMEALKNEENAANYKELQKIIKQHT